MAIIGILVLDQGTVHETHLRMTDAQIQRFEIVRASNPALYRKLSFDNGDQADIALAIGIHGWSLEQIQNYFKQVNWSI